MRRQSKVVSMLCSIPPDVRAWLEEQAQKNLIPMNGVIVTTLRRAMESERAAQVAREKASAA